MCSFVYQSLEGGYKNHPQWRKVHWSIKLQYFVSPPKWFFRVGINWNHPCPWFCHQRFLRIYWMGFLDTLHGDRPISGNDAFFRRKKIKIFARFSAKIIRFYLLSVVTFPTFSDMLAKSNALLPVSLWLRDLIYKVTTGHQTGHQRSQN